MADPRDAIAPNDVDLEFDFFKIDNSTITYSATADYGSTQAGQNLAVTLSADNTVALADDAEAIKGRLEEVMSDNYCRVATRGKKMRFKGGDSATLTRGKGIVGDQGPAAALGYVRVVNGAVQAEVENARGMILDDDATNPMVELP